MGIPKYFSYLMRNYSDINIDITKLKKVDNLYVDFNAMIHPIAHEFQNEQDIIHQCIIQLNALIEYIKPTHMTYIATDGVAPRAKMNQQRIRRFKAQLRSDPPLFDTNAITPGTRFMEKLSIALHDPNAFKHINQTVIISDSNEPNEGEHKILHNIRTNAPNTVNVIHGLDADLIMLSLTIEDQHMYISRKQEDDTLLFVDIKKLYTYIGMEHSHKTLSVGTMVTDYIILCFLAGNDFLPHIPSIQISNSGIDILWEIYLKLIHHYNTPLFNRSTFTFNNALFVNILSDLGQKEEEMIKNIGYAMQRREHRAEQQREMDRHTTILHTTSDIASQSTQHRPPSDYVDIVNDPIQFLKRGWKTRYYSVLFDIHLNDYNYINKMCAEYIQGIVWTSLYYFDVCPEWSWYYPYNAAPCVSDIYKWFNYIKSSNVDIQNIYQVHQRQNIHMHNLNQKIHVMNKGAPVSPITQLLMVLPPISVDLLPEHYRDLITSSTSPLIEYYPIMFEMNTIHKTATWQFEPIIPLINQEEVEKAMNNI